MEHTQRRLDELKAKAEHGLSDVEFRELVSLSPPGEVVKLPNLAVAGLKDFEQALENFGIVGKQAKLAFEKGFFVEVIALRSQSLELFLRIYVAVKTGLTPSFPIDDKTTLGGLIKRSEDAGLEASMVAQLRTFNADRISGLHHFLLGSASYSSLGDLCVKSKDLMQALVASISTDIGTPQ